MAVIEDAILSDAPPRASTRTILPIVAIVGQPNVGKSALFNRLLRQRNAVVHGQPGVTRDRNYGICEWGDRDFYVVDTGGMIPESEVQLDRAVLEQARYAVREADVILLVVDCHIISDRINDVIARELQDTKKPVFVVANKADNETYAIDAARFQRLGLGEPIPVSAMMGIGAGDLLDEVVKALPSRRTVTNDENVVRVAIIGRPNVGKSSIVNKLVGQERQVVSPIAGTTRDAVDTPLTYRGQDYLLVDTAGLRHKSKIKESIEFYTTLRAVKALEDCDVAVVVIDATEALTTQDMRVIEQAHKARRGVLLVSNKWDIVPEKDSKLMDVLTREYAERLGPYAYIPVLFISALTGSRVRKILDESRVIYQRARVRVKASDLNNFIIDIQRRHMPAAIKGKEVRITYAAQTSIDPPTFSFFSNHPELIQKSYINYLSNKLHERFDLRGVSVRLKFVQK